jgi:hypothetical protein
VFTVLDENSLNFFNLDHPIRELCIEFMLSKWFDRIVLLAVIGNALFIAANDPLHDKDEMVNDLTLHIHSNHKHSSFMLRTSSSMLYFSSNLL